jgi:serine/threonine protein kinase
MPNTVLTQIIESINSLDNLQTKVVVSNFSKSGFNSHTIYRVTGVSAVVKTKGSKTVSEDIEIVFSMPLTSDSPAHAKNIKAAIVAEDTLIRKKISSPFNHSYLYRGSDGCLISEYTPHSDLFNLATSEQLNDYCGLENLRNLIAQVLLAVEAYHAKRLAHRDIKPENFLVYEQDGLYILKLCDHDDVIEVNHFGKALVRPHKRVGSIEYHSPEYIIEADVLAKMDYRANDCYAAGLTLNFILENMKRQKGFQTNTTTTPGFVGQLVFLSSLIEELTSPKPETRPSIETALQSLFFGNTLSQRLRYFHHIQAIAKRTLSINGYPITGSIANLNDAHYLLPKPINAVYRSGSDVAHLIEIFYPSFNKFTSAKNSKYCYRQIKIAAQKHFKLVAILKKETSPSLRLLAGLHEFELEYEAELSEFSKLFMENLALSIKHVVHESVANYKELMKGASKRGLCSAQPTLFQRLNYHWAHEMTSKITPESCYKEAFKTINDYIGEHRGFGEHTFKNILMKNLLHVLHESLHFIRSEIDETAHVNKRVRH